MRRKDEKMLREYLLYRLSATQDKLKCLIDSLTLDEIDICDSINCDIEYYIYLLENYDKKFKKEKRK